MLRNHVGLYADAWQPVLNEVLSLNAQELQTLDENDYYDLLLNEVLSLNAQE